MADNTIDSLALEISSNSAGAKKALDKLAGSLARLQKSMNLVSNSKLGGFNAAIKNLKDSLTGFSGVGNLEKGITQIQRLSRLNSDGLSKAAVGLTEVSDALKGMNGISIPNLDGLELFIANIRKFGGKNVGAATKNLSVIARDLVNLVSELNQVGAITFDFSGLQSLVQSISNLGLSKAVNATKNMKTLKDQLLRFISGLNGIGKLNFDVSGLNELVTALSKLGYSAALKAPTNIRELADSMRYLLSTLSQAPNVSQNVIQMANAMAQLAASGGRAGVASKALANGFNIIPASASKARKGFSGLAGAIGKFYATYWLLIRALGGFRKAIDISSDLTEVQNVVDVTFGEMSDTINDFAKSALQNYGMSELMAKQIASRFQAMGVSIGFAQGKMSEISIELTKLAGDMASFYNESQESVAKALQSIFTGETEPMRRFGLDLSFATVEAWALSQGIDADMKSMTNAEKTMLRYQFVLSRTGAASGDFLRTINSWHNQLVLLVGGFQQLGSIVGGVLINAFKPFIQALNSVMGAVINFAKVISDALGAIFGWEYQTGGGVAQDLELGAGAAGGIEDAMGGAADKAKEMNKYIAGWHELNIMNTNDDSGGGGASGGSGATGADGGKWIQKESLWEKYTSSIDSLYELGDYIGGVLTDAMNSINWDKVYESARNFGSGLASFLNGLISPSLFGAVGATIASALNTAIYAALSFGESFDWSGFGLSIASGINNFFSTFDFGSLANTIDAWAQGILDSAIAAVEKIEWGDIGEKIGEFLQQLDFTKALKKVGKLIWEGINAGFEFYEGMFETAPLETALLTLVGVTKLLKSNNVTKFVRSVSKGIDSVVNFGKALSGSEIALEAIRTSSPKVANVISTLTKAFSNFRFGIENGNFLSGINEGLGTIRNSLSGMDKLVIGAASSFSEFFIVKDSMKDLAIGTGDVLTNILELVSSAGLAGAAMYTAFGPAGAAFAAVTALVAALSGLYDGLTDNSELENWKEDFVDSLEEINMKSNTIKDSLSNLRSDFEETGIAQSQMATDMADKYEQLHSKLNPTAEDVAKMKQYSSDLVNMYPELEQYFNKETGLLEINRDEIQKTIEKQLELVKAKAALSALEESYKQQMKAAQNLADAKEKEKTAYENLRKAQEEYNAYLDAHPTYAQTGTQGLFEGDILGVEAKKLQDAMLITAKAVTDAKNTVSEAQDTYDAAGKSVSNFAEVYEQSAYQTSIASENIQKIFEDLKSGIEVNTPTLKTAFKTIGYDLPDEMINTFKEKGSEVQNSTVELLYKIKDGHKAEESDLLKIFSALGIEVSDSLITSLKNEGASTQKAAIELLSQIQTASDEQRGPLLENLESLGIDASGMYNTGLASHNDEIKDTSETMVENTKQPLINEFSSDTSGDMYDYGANASKGFWQGVKDWWDDSWLGRKINEFKQTISGPSGLDEHSPSKVMELFGIYAIEGFNIGLAEKMPKTYSLIGNWVDNLKDVGSVSLDVPKLNTYIPKPSFTSASYDLGKFKSTIQMEMDSRAAEQQWEIRQQNELLREQNELLRGIYEKPVLTDDDVFNATRRGQNRFQRRTFKTGWAGVD